MRLVYELDNSPVEIGDVVELDDELWEVADIVPPHDPASTGRVYLAKSGSNGYEQGFYPSVIGAVWD